MQDEPILGARDLYDVVLKAYCDMNINGKKYSKGEVICRFDTIQVANLNEKKNHTAAMGGYGNQELVVWDDTEKISIGFYQGVFSKTQLSILTNANMAKKIAQDKELIPCYEEQISNENMQIELKNYPEDLEIFIYDKQSGEKISNYTRLGKIISLNKKYQEVCVDYYTKYENNSTLFQIGLPATNGFMRLEGKTRLKDDITGKITTGILTIPKLKLKTGLSIKLGQSSAPMVSNFYGEGFPESGKRNKVVCTLLVLSDDIDSDF